MTYCSVVGGRQDRSESTDLGYKLLGLNKIQRCPFAGPDLKPQSQILLLEGRCTAELSSYPIYTHLNPLIKVFGLLEMSRQVCWGRLELNPAGHWPSKSRTGPPSPKDAIFFSESELSCYEKEVIPNICTTKADTH